MLRWLRPRMQSRKADEVNVGPALCKRRERRWAQAENGQRMRGKGEKEAQLRDLRIGSGLTWCGVAVRDAREKHTLQTYTTRRAKAAEQQRWLPSLCRRTLLACTSSLLLRCCCCYSPPFLGSLFSTQSENDPLDDETPSSIPSSSGFFVTTIIHNPLTPAT